MNHPDIERKERTGERPGRGDIDQSPGEFTCCVTITGSADDIDAFRETVEHLGDLDEYTIGFVSEPGLNNY